MKCSPAYKSRTRPAKCSRPPRDLRIRLKRFPGPCLCWLCARGEPHASSLLYPLLPCKSQEMFLPQDSAHRHAKLENLLNRYLLPSQTWARMDPAAQGLSTSWNTGYTTACPSTACLVSPLLQFQVLQQRCFPPAADSSSQNLFLMNQVKPSSAQVFSKAPRLRPSDAVPDPQAFTTP